MWSILLTPPIPGWQFRQEMNMAASQNDTAEFTKRALLGLMTEWADYKEHGQRIEAAILALAVANGLPGVLPDPAG
jgi:hypothetical protein